MSWSKKGTARMAGLGLLGLVSLVAGCGVTHIVIVARPDQATLAPSESLEITAVVTGTSNSDDKAVTWSVCNGDGNNCVSSGNSTRGTLSVSSPDSNGNSVVSYVAPSSQPSSPDCTEELDGCSIIVKAQLVHFDAACFARVKITGPANPVPVISMITPSTVTVGGADFALMVDGSGFIASSTVQVDGNARATTFIDANTLEATVLAADIATAGTANVTVVNPGPGGGTSNIAVLNINNPAPVITTLTPSSASAGDPAFTLTVDGSGFIASSAVQWAGSNRATTFVNDTQLTADIPATDLATAGTADVTVVNPAPGGGTSPAAPFTINATSTMGPQLVSLNNAGTASGSGFSYITEVGRGCSNSAFRRCISSDNRFVLFVSDAPDLVPNDTNGGARDVFVRDRQAATTVLVSENLSGTSSTTGNSNNPFVDLSTDGRFVIFTSTHSDLASSDTNGLEDVFWRDTCLGASGGCTPTTQLISVNGAGTDSGNGVSSRGDLSADGRYVAFLSQATDLVPGISDSNGNWDVFLRDSCGGAVGCTPTTTLISVNSAGTGTGDQGVELTARAPAVVSADGRFVLFTSRSTDLGPGAPSGFAVFVRDTCIGAVGCTPSTVLVADGNANSIAMTADGSRVLFQAADATALTGVPDANGSADIFVRDLPAGPVTLITINAAGTATGNAGSSFVATMTPDGRFVVFTSAASNLVMTDTNGAEDVFLHDTCLGAAGPCTPTTEVLSINASGTDTSGAGTGLHTPSVSDDGSRIAFETLATDLLVNPPPLFSGAQIAVVRDRTTGSTIALTAFTHSTLGPRLGQGGVPVLSADGTLAILESTDPLVDTDTNGTNDVYVAVP